MSTALLSGQRTIFEVTDPTATSSGGSFPTSGSRYVVLLPGDPPAAGAVFFTVTFGSAQSAFGFFATDIEVNQFELVLIRDDGSRRHVPVPVTVPQGSGGICYFGVIDLAEPFAAVEFRNIGTAPDGFAFDDLTIGTPEQVVTELHVWPAVELGWFARTGALYQLQWTSQLPTTQWFNLGTPIIGTSITNYVFDSTRAYGRRFYRVVSTNQ
jgi:hypothetical protein